MNKILIHVNNNIGISQAQLAFLTLKSIGKEQYIFKHNQKLNASLIDNIDGVLVIGETTPEKIKNAFSIKVTPIKLEDVINSPDEILKKITYKNHTNSSIKKIVAITACLTDIAHSYMAAEALKIGAKKSNYSIKIETQGSVGEKNTLTTNDIEQADIIIIAADTNLSLDRFIGKKIYKTSTKNAIKNSQSLIKDAIKQAKIYTRENFKKIKTIKNEVTNNESFLNTAYKHLMTGFSFMLAFVVASGFLFSLGNLVNNLHITFSAELLRSLILPVFSGYIAYSISGRVALVSGFLGGGLSELFHCDFLGAIFSGFIAGYSVIIIQKIRLNELISGLMPVLIIPIISGLVTFSIIYFLSIPITLTNNLLIGIINQTSGVYALIIGAILGSMMAYHMGGLSNKIAYVFATGLLISGVYSPMAAVVAAEIVPPLGIYVASFFLKNFFSNQEQKKSKKAGILGLCFITEGAIYFSKNRPKQVIPSIILGSSISGALSMYMGIKLHIPHGGIFPMLLPGIVDQLFTYLIIIMIGVISCAFTLTFLTKKSIPTNS